MSISNRSDKVTPRALQHIYMKYRSRLISLALRMRVSGDVAEDLLHDVMLSLNPTGSMICIYVTASTVIWPPV